MWIECYGLNHFCVETKLMFYIYGPIVTNSSDQWEYSAIGYCYNISSFDHLICHPDGHTHGHTDMTQWLLEHHLQLMVLKIFLAILLIKAVICLENKSICQLNQF